MEFEGDGSPFEDAVPMQARATVKVLKSEQALVKRMGEPVKSEEKYSFKRGYGIISPADYQAVADGFMNHFEGKAGMLGGNKEQATEIAGELFRNAFKFGVGTEVFGGEVNLVEYETPQLFAFGFPGGRGVIPEQLVNMYATDATPHSFTTQDGLHGNCFRKIQEGLQAGRFEAVAFPEDRRGMFLLLKKQG